MTDNSTLQVASTETPLHYYREQMKAVSTEHAEVSELERKGHLVIRAQLDDAGFADAMQDLLGFMPPAPCRFSGDSRSTMYWLGPTECLLVVDAGMEEETRKNLREKFDGHMATIDVSAGQTIIEARGNDIEVLLKKSCVYDFHPHNFAPGRCVQTNFAKTSALIARHDDCFRIIVRRSFADYAWEWIRDALS